MAKDQGNNGDDKGGRKRPGKPTSGDVRSDIAAAIANCSDPEIRRSLLLLQELNSRDSTGQHIFLKTQKKILEDIENDNVPGDDVLFSKNKYDRLHNDVWYAALIRHGLNPPQRWRNHYHAGPRLRRLQAIRRGDKIIPPLRPSKASKQLKKDQSARDEAEDERLEQEQALRESRNQIAAPAASNQPPSAQALSQPENHSVVQPENHGVTSVAQPYGYQPILSRPIRPTDTQDAAPTGQNVLHGNQQPNHPQTQPSFLNSSGGFPNSLIQQDSYHPAQANQSINITSTQTGRLNPNHLVRNRQHQLPGPSLLHRGNPLQGLTGFQLPTSRQLSYNPRINSQQVNNNLQLDYNQQRGNQQPSTQQFNRIQQFHSTQRLSGQQLSGRQPGHDQHPGYSQQLNYNQELSSQQFGNQQIGYDQQISYDQQFGYYQQLGDQQLRNQLYPAIFDPVINGALSSSPRFSRADAGIQQMLQSQQRSFFYNRHTAALGQEYNFPSLLGDDTQQQEECQEEPGEGIQEDSGEGVEEEE
ncbi:hypothetical protein EsH8_IV_001387 [Colletotrichum jinshuiense]